MTRTDLFENIQDYSPKEIASAIQQGIVTFYELQTNTHGQFSPLTQRHVKAILGKGDVTEEAEVPNTEIAKDNRPSFDEPIISTTPIITQEPVQIQEPEQESQPQPQQVPFTPSALSFEVTGAAAPTPQNDPTSQNQHSQLIPCPECGKMISPRALKCPSCGMPLKDNTQAESPVTIQEPEQDPVIPVPQQVVQTQGQPIQNPTPQVNKFEDVPSNIRSFSWGGFIFTWIWGVCNGVYWSLFALIPVANFVISLILGFRGNRYAWEAQKDRMTKEVFVRRQRGWNIAVIILTATVFFIMLLFIVLIIFLDEYMYY